jgi:hypothetical protein
MSAKRHDRELRRLFGWLSAPIVAWLTLWVVLVVVNALGWYGPRESLRNSFTALFDLAKIVIPMAAIAEGLFARPLVDWFQKTGRRNLRDYVIAGGVVGALPFLLYLLLIIVNSTRSGSFHIASDGRFAVFWALMGVPPGAAAASVFWLLIVRGPD